jgi:hypothetical protein
MFQQFFDRLRSIPLIFSTILLCPSILFVGHIFTCNDFTPSSRIMECASGDTVSDNWLLVGIISSSIPAILFLIKKTFFRTCAVKELDEDGCIPCSEDES